MAVQSNSSGLKFVKHFGLDIGSSSVKIVQLDLVSGGWKLVAIGDWPIPEGLTGVARDQAITEGVRVLTREAKVTVKQVAISLPESQVYTRVVEMPYLPEPELSAAIKWQAEQYLPVPLSDVVHKHQVLRAAEAGAGTEKMDVLLVAAPTTLVNNYIGIASKAGFETIAVETEVFAVTRAIALSQNVTPTTLVVDFGSDASAMAVLEQNEIMLVQPSSFGSRALTRAIAKDLALEQNQAEEYKKSYGLDTSKLEGKIALSIKPLTEVFANEIKKVIAFYSSKVGVQPIRRIMLSGGGSLIDGFVPYLTDTLGLEVLMGNPFAPVSLTENQEKLVGGSGPIFATAVGLALKQV